MHNATGSPADIPRSIKGDPTFGDAWTNWKVFLNRRPEPDAVACAVGAGEGQRRARRERGCVQ